MNSTLSAILISWSFAPWLAFFLGLTAAIYLRGWRRLRRRGVRQFQFKHLTCFYAGLGTIYIALMSPLDALAPLLMSAHMVQHLLLMLVAPPLLWLAAPEIPMVAGLPAAVRRTWVIPLWQLPALRRFAAWLTRPATAWTTAVVVLWLWHVPALYQWTLQDRWIHDVEHVSFLLSSLLFWFPVIRPHPHRRNDSFWLLLPYLFLAGVQGSVLSGMLTFADHVLYPHYEQVPRLWGLSALADQAIGGALMWTIGSLAYLIPLVLTGRLVLKSSSAAVVFRRSCTSHQSLPSPVFAGAERAAAAPNLSGSMAAIPWFEQRLQTRDSEAVSRGGRSADLASSVAVSTDGLLPVLSSESCCKASAPPLDVLQVPVMGAVLRRGTTRHVLQCILLAAAVIVVVDGLSGPQLAPANLAGVTPWIHWRWLLVMGLLAAGNLFCMACPFTLARHCANACLPSSWTWPHWLSNKGPAIVLLLLFFWAYELFALWDSPWWTAWIVVGYFSAAVAVNGLFRGAPFCRYVCPIGQFNFVYSLVSPLEVKVRNPQVCQTCRSHSCLRGSETMPGCEMGLFQPQKQGNFDCTFCLDCVRSCAHDNVGLIAGLPIARLAASDHLDGGRNTMRTSALLLIVVLSAAAVLSAGWMTGLGSALQWQAQNLLGEYGNPALVTAGTIFGLLILPLALIFLVGSASGAAEGTGDWRRNVGRYAPALIPMGLGIWAAHYTYHFLAGAGTLVAAAWRFAGDHGLASFASTWTCPCCAGELAPWMLPTQCLLLDLGLLASLYALYVVSRRQHGRSRQALTAAAPWAILVLALFAISAFLLLEPMEMRGTLAAWPGGGP